MPTKKLRGAELPLEQDLANQVLHGGCGLSMSTAVSSGVAL